MLENLCKVRIPVVLLGNFPVFPVLIKGLLVAADFCQFPFRCPFYEQRENQFDDFSGIGVDDQLVLVLGVLYISIRSKCADILPVAPLVIKYLTDLL